MNDRNNDGDADSLFGSPPSSPRQTRGRSPSLALPGSLGVVDASGINVGTIALPGSHNSSELVVNLPASPPRSQAQRVAPQQYLSALSQTNLGEKRGPSVPSRKEVKPTKRKEKAANAGIPATGPSLTLPDASEPLPPNFLRNQQALLGLAGVVGGINPAHLSTRSSRGATAQNPIIVEEEAPSISQSTWKVRRPQFPTELPAPSAQAVADTLVAQGNIFPVLRSLLPLLGASTDVGCCPGTHGSSYHSSHTNQLDATLVPPPLKKRKLNSVPAGAGDWDVPYPFPNNEGPRGYRENWEKERGKNLVLQLVSLVREAVQKAATKTYVQKKQLEDLDKAMEPIGPVPSYYRSSTTGVEGAGSSSHLHNPMAPSTNPTSPSGLDGSQFASSSHPFSYQERNAAFSSHQSMRSDLESLIAVVNAHFIDPNVELTDDDFAAMSSLDFSSTAPTSPTLTSSSRLTTPCDFPSSAAAENKENHAPRVAMQDWMARTQSNILDYNFNIPIDPMLFESPISVPSILSTQGLNGYTSYHSQETAATSGVSDVSLGQWQGQQEEEISADPIVNAPSQPNPSLDIDFIAPPSIQTGSNLSPSEVASSQTLAHTAVSFSPPQVLEYASTTSSSFAPPINGIKFMPPMTEMPAPVPARSDLTRPPVKTTKTLDRNGILQRARFRREQLVAEIARGKIELWETTIEQGVLINLSKDKQASGNDSHVAMS